MKTCNWLKYFILLLQRWPRLLARFAFLLLWRTSLYRAPDLHECPHTSDRHTVCPPLPLPCYGRPDIAWLSRILRSMIRQRSSSYQRGELDGNSNNYNIFPPSRMIFSCCANPPSLLLPKSGWRTLWASQHNLNTVTSITRRHIVPLPGFIFSMVCRWWDFASR